MYLGVLELVASLHHTPSKFMRVVCGFILFSVALTAGAKEVAATAAEKTAVTKKDVAATVNDKPVLAKEKKDVAREFLRHLTCFQTMTTRSSMSWITNLIGQKWHMEQTAAGVVAEFGRHSSSVAASCGVMVGDDAQAAVYFTKMAASLTPAVDALAQGHPANEIDASYFAQAIADYTGSITWQSSPIEGAGKMRALLSKVDKEAIRYAERSEKVLQSFLESVPTPQEDDLIFPEGHSPLAPKKPAVDPNTRMRRHAKVAQLPYAEALQAAAKDSDVEAQVDTSADPHPYDLYKKQERGGVEVINGDHTASNTPKDHDRRRGRDKNQLPCFLDEPGCEEEKRPPEIYPPSHPDYPGPAPRHRDGSRGNGNRNGDRVTIPDGGTGGHDHDSSTGRHGGGHSGSSHSSSGGGHSGNDSNNGYPPHPHPRHDPWPPNTPSGYPWPDGNAHDPIPYPPVPGGSSGGGSTEDGKTVPSLPDPNNVPTGAETRLPDADYVEDYADNRNQAMDRYTMLHAGPSPAYTYADQKLGVNAVSKGKCLGSKVLCQQSEKMWQEAKTKAKQRLASKKPTTEGSCYELFGERVCDKT